MASEKQAEIIDKIFDPSEVLSPFGKRGGGEKLLLTAEQLQALQQGKSIAVDVMSEYVLFIQLQQTDSAFGLWKDQSADGLVYQQQIRSEW